MKRRSVSRQMLATIATIGCLMAVLSWSGWQMQASRAAAQLAAENLGQCQALAQKIAALQHGPSRATLKAKSSTELAKRLEQAARAAKVASDRITRINPQPARRVGETVYKEQQTRVELRGVTLRQLVTFLDAVTGEATGLHVAGLRISAPRQEGASTQKNAETWIAEVTLTEFVFTAKS